MDEFLERYLQATKNWIFYYDICCKNFVNDWIDHYFWGDLKGGPLFMENKTLCQLIREYILAIYHVFSESIYYRSDNRS